MVYVFPLGLGQHLDASLGQFLYEDLVDQLQDVFSGSFHLDSGVHIPHRIVKEVTGLVVRQNLIGVVIVSKGILVLSKFHLQRGFLFYLFLSLVGLLQLLLGSLDIADSVVVIYLLEYEIFRGLGGRFVISHVKCTDLYLYRVSI